MQELADRTESDEAPGAKTLPVIANTCATAPGSLDVAPFDPTLPPPDNDGLTGNDDCVGRDSAYEPGNTLRCEQQDPTLVCTSDRKAWNCDRAALCPAGVWARRRGGVLRMGCSGRGAGSPRPPSHLPRPGQTRSAIVEAP